MAINWRHATYVKLYVREEGTFAMLPLYTRALARELLIACDDDGCIPCAGMEPHLAIMRRLGGTLGDRRRVKEDVDRLIADGYLVRGPDCVCVKNFSVAQARGERSRGAAKPASHPRRESGETATEARQQESENSAESLETRRVVSIDSIDRRSMSGSRPTAAARESSDEARREAESFVAWFNHRFQRSFAVRKETVRMVKALLRDGHSQKDLRAVAWVFGRDWDAKPDMQRYVTPGSLLRSTKFGERLDVANRELHRGGAEGSTEPPVSHPPGTNGVRRGERTAADAIRAVLAGRSEDA
jgi:hypothetical protein